MTISSQITPSVHTGNGTAGPFTFDWRITSSSDLDVIIRDTTDSTDTGATLTLDAANGYTVSGVNAASGGSITLTGTYATSVTSDFKIMIRDRVSTTQTSDFRNATSVTGPRVEDAVERNTRAINTLREDLDLSLKFAPILDDQAPGAYTNGDLPVPTANSIPIRNNDNDGWLMATADYVVTTDYSTENMLVDRFVDSTDYTSGTTTQLTLSSAPAVENNTQVFFDGVYQDKSTYSLSGTTLTFDAAIPSGTNAVEVNHAEVLSIGTPSDDTVTTAKIVDDAVTAAKIADDAVVEAAILDGAVTTGKIENDAVTTDKIIDNAVTTAKINDDAVTAAKIADDAVVTAGIQDDAVTTAKIVDDAVTTDKVVDQAVTNAKLASVATDTFKGRTTAGTGVVEDLTATQARAILNVEDGADVTDATNVLAALVGQAIASITTIGMTGRLTQQLGSDSAAHKIERTGTSTGAFWLGAVGDRDGADTYDEARLWNGALSAYLAFIYNDSTGWEMGPSAGDLQINSDVDLNSNDINNVNDLNVAGFLTLEGASNGVVTNTSDGTDNAEVYINAGGAGSTTRGAMIILDGNEHANTGLLSLEAGNVSGGDVSIKTQGTERVNIGYDGTVDLNDNDLVGVGSNTPASAAATGTTGTITWDSSYIYIATATDTWKRVAIATW